MLWPGNVVHLSGAFKRRRKSGQWNQLRDGFLPIRCGDEREPPGRPGDHKHCGKQRFVYGGFGFWGRGFSGSGSVAGDRCADQWPGHVRDNDAAAEADGNAVRHHGGQCLGRHLERQLVRDLFGRGELQQCRKFF